MPRVARPSLASLYIEMKVRGNKLSSGTGFLVSHQGRTFLVTNRHNLSGRRADTNEILSKATGACPDSVTIYHNQAGKLGSWIPKDEPVIDAEEAPLWLEHRTFGRKVDVAALPLTDTFGVETTKYQYDLFHTGNQIALRIAGEASVVGFPYGRSGWGKLGIWVRGNVATEPEINFEELPCFLIDSRTRTGQSGSPVIVYRNGGEMVALEDGGMGAFDGPVQRLFGIYSGRINKESDLGYVWKVSAIQDVVVRGVRNPVGPVEEPQQESSVDL